METLDPRSADFGWLAQLMRWVGVLIYLAMAGQMLRYLLAPGPEDGEAILTLGVLMGFEFIVVHSGVFMAAMGRSKAILLFVPIYGLFAWVFNQFAPNNAVMWLYLSLVLTRMRFAFSNPTKESIARNGIFSFGAVTAYFFLVMIFAFSSEVLPQFGITDTYLEQINYSSLHNSGGIFVDLPHVPLSMGVIYFSLLAWMEWRLFRPQS